MNIRNTYGLIHIGLLIRLLRNISESSKAELVIKHIDLLETELKTAELLVSLSAVTELNKMTDVKARLKTLDKNELIGQEIQKLLTEEMQSVEKVVFSEALIKKIYVIPQRRYNGNYLLNEPAKLLKNDIFGKLSDIAKFDFTSACRCLSFGEGTACAFHILRATEDTLKQFYFSLKKTNRMEKPMWGPMTIELRAKKTNRPDESILNALDVVRTSYRNPTQHPLVTYDIDSAQDLFGVCVDLINKMANIIPAQVPGTRNGKA